MDAGAGRLSRPLKRNRDGLYRDAYGVGGRLFQPMSPSFNLRNRRKGIDLKILGLQEPNHSLYTDLVNLADPVYLGLTMRIFNYDDVSLYLRVDGYAAGWTFTTTDLGAYGSGGSAYLNIDNFAYRARPGAALTEDLTIRLRGYTDAGYTNLKWTALRTVTMVFIKSDDGSWTQDFLNNFDDGTLQGWAVVKDWADGLGTTPSVAVQTDFKLSPPYSARAYYRMDSGMQWCHGIRMYKSFTIPDKNYVFAIMNIRGRQTHISGAGGYPKWYNFREVGVTIIHLGRPSDYLAQTYVPLEKWMRAVMPLTRNVTEEIRIAFCECQTGSGINDIYLWLDDFMIISKN